MIKIIKTNLIIILLIFLSLKNYGQAPKYSNDFMNIGIGGRALGMSNSVVASTNDVTSGYWNPSGLLLIKEDLQLGLMHASYFAGIASHNYISFAFNNKENALGFSFIRTGIDDIPNTIDLFDNNGIPDLNRIKSFSVSFNGFLFSYAKKTNVEGLRIGGNIKIIRNSMGEFANSWGFGLDASAGYDIKTWKFGILARDITTTFNAWNFTLSDKVIEIWTLTGNEIPKNHIETTLPRIITGVGKNFTFWTNYSALIEINADFTFDGLRNTLIKSNTMSVDPHLGIELGFKNIAFVRAGLCNIQQTTFDSDTKNWTIQPNIGIGVNILDKFTIDYALTNIANASEVLYSNVFSLKLNIKRRKSTPSL